MSLDFGDDGRIRKGTLWSGTAHAITATIGSGILALPWSVAQLGWVLGVVVLVTFAVISYYTATLLCDCYRSPDPVNGRRNPTYMDAVKAFLGPKSVVLCAVVQYTNLWGTMIGYTITTAISIASVKRTTCHHEKGHDAKCGVAVNTYMLIFGAVEIILSQCQNLEKVALISVVAALTSFGYALIALYLSISKFAINHKVGGSLMVGHVGNNIASSTKVWHAFQALGNIAFAYSYATILLEIQDTLKSPPTENKVMKKVTTYAVSITAIFYIGLGCLGYAAFGSDAPGNVLSGFYELFWLVYIGNLSVVIHLVAAYAVFAQPIFATNEKWMSAKWPTTSFFNHVYTIRLFGVQTYSVHFTLCKLLLRPAFVIFTTILAMMFPFFNAILGLLGAISFWPLTVYFPVNMYIQQSKIKRESFIWVALQSLSMVCLIVTFVAAIGSIADILDTFQHASSLFHINLYRLSEALYKLLFLCNPFL